MSSKSKKQRKKLKPLKITCTSADCDNGLHCFKKSRQMAESDYGNCRYCDADLVNWDRLHERNLSDAAFTFKALKYELVRHYMWHRTIEVRTRNHARRKGRVKLREAARKKLIKSVGPAKPSFDGRQTSWNGNNIICDAQHALACCCRACLEYWHGIPKGVELTDEQIEYLVELVMLFIDERMPYLTAFGEKIPPIRNKEKVRIGGK